MKIILYKERKMKYLLLDEYFTIDETGAFNSYSDNYPEQIQMLRKVGKPTFALIHQDLEESNKKAYVIRKQRLKHNERIVKVIDTNVMIGLKKEYGSFILKGNLAEFKNINYIITDELFLKVIRKQRIFKK